jgi:tetratricopeptide (TPR) repeat protein
MLRLLARAALAAALVLPPAACSKREPVAAAAVVPDVPDEEAVKAAREAAYRKHLDDATAALDANNSDAALAHLKQALAERPDGADAHHQLGRALVAKKDEAGALKAFGEAVRLDSQQADAYLERAAIHDRAGRLDDASFDYRKAIAIEHDPKTTARAYWLRGDVMDRLGKREDYRYDREKALALDPEYQKRVRGGDLRVFNHSDEKLKIAFTQFVNPDGTERTFPPGFAFTIPDNNSAYLLVGDRQLAARSVRFTVTALHGTKAFSAAYEKGMTFEVHIFQANLPQK